MDEMKRIVICEFCRRPEYYGEMRWLSGKCLCRICYRAEWEVENKKFYTFDDLNGRRPTMEEFKAQEEQE